MSIPPYYFLFWPPFYLTQIPSSLRILAGVYALLFCDVIARLWLPYFIYLYYPSSFIVSPSRYNQITIAAHSSLPSRGSFLTLFRRSLLNHNLTHSFLRQSQKKQIYTRSLVLCQKNNRIKSTLAKFTFAQVFCCINYTKEENSSCPSHPWAEKIN